MGARNDEVMTAENAEHAETMLAPEMLIVSLNINILYFTSCFRKRRFIFRVFRGFRGHSSGHHPSNRLTCGSLNPVRDAGNA